MVTMNAWAGRRGQSGDRDLGGYQGGSALHVHLHTPGGVPVAEAGEGLGQAAWRLVTHQVLEAPTPQLLVLRPQQRCRGRVEMDDPTRQVDGQDRVGHCLEQGAQPVSGPGAAPGLVTDRALPLIVVVDGHGS